jgi:hypothetical protein
MNRLALARPIVRQLSNSSRVCGGPISYVNKPENILNWVHPDKGHYPNTPLSNLDACDATPLGFRKTMHKYGVFGYYLNLFKYMCTAGLFFCFPYLVTTHNMFMHYGPQKP